jgi:hypothetical protein
VLLNANCETIQRCANWSYSTIGSPLLCEPQNGLPVKIVLPVVGGTT